jgi:hypothetical protein
MHRNDKGKNASKVPEHRNKHKAQSNKLHSFGIKITEEHRNRERDRNLSQHMSEAKKKRNQRTQQEREIYIYNRLEPKSHDIATFVNFL